MRKQKKFKFKVVLRRNFILDNNNNFSDKTIRVFKWSPGEGFVEEPFSPLRSKLWVTDLKISPKVSSTLIITDDSFVYDPNVNGLTLISNKFPPYLSNRCVSNTTHSVQGLPQCPWVNVIYRNDSLQLVQSRNRKLKITIFSVFL